MFKQLDPLLHSELRLKIVSLLVGVESAEFNWLLEQTGAIHGNLSVQINMQREVGYIDVKKSFRRNYPLTTCRITEKGSKAFEEYVEALKEYLKLKYATGLKTCAMC